MGLNVVFRVHPKSPGVHSASASVSPKQLGSWDASPAPEHSLSVFLGFFTYLDS